MKVNRITPMLYSNQKVPLNNKRKNNNKTTNNSYNPIAYRDYNVNFGARLFRTPENFYEQPFNKNGMPDAMKNYLYADYEDRKNMPPSQMMKLVYEDIEMADSLSDVKELYPEEPLFKNLTDAKNKRVKTGVLAEIDLMKSEGKTLFKNGNDNLGLYLLKKVYLEGKTLKEINKDFEKDISVYYKGLSPIQYETLSAYGIKFPNSAFWKSFTATREDFPYEYKPRKVIATRIQGGQKTTPQENLPKKTKVEKGKFADVKDWEIDKLAKAMVGGKGNVEATKKQMKKQNIRDKESLSFVARYMKQINSIVLDRMHVSDEMKSFFNQANNLSATQQEKFTKYWQNPSLNELQSTLMKDTIKLFFEEYGVDGNNENFKRLLNYADNGIKQERMLPANHAEKQAMYDDLFANYDFKEDVKPIAESLPEAPKSMEEIVKDAVENKEPSLFIKPSSKEIIYNGNLNGDFQKALQQEMELLPDSYAKKYSSFFMKHPLINDKFKISLVAGHSVPDKHKELIYSPEELANISTKVNKEFDSKFVHQTIASNQAISRMIFDLDFGKNTERTLTVATNDLVGMLDKVGFKHWSQEQKAKLNNYYHEYMTPLTSKDDIKQVNSMLLEYVVNLDAMRPRSLKGDGQVNTILCNISDAIKIKPSLEKELEKVIKYSDFINIYGGSSRFLFDKGITKEAKSVKLQLMFEDFIVANQTRLQPFFTSVENVLKSIRMIDIMKGLRF